MQTSNRVLDDLAKVAGGAVSTLAGVKQEMESQVQNVLQKILADMDLVPREEFDAIKAVAVKARSEQEKLERRVEALEKQLSGQKKNKASVEKTPKTPKTSKTKKKT